MREIELFLNILAEKVADARLGDRRLETREDFAAWLRQCGLVASRCETPATFFRSIS